MRQRVLWPSGCQQWMKQVLQMYDVDTEEVLYKAMAPGKDTVNTITWCKHETLAAWCVSGSVLYIWKYAENKVEKVHDFRSPITALRQSETDPRIVAVGCEDNLLCIYDLQAKRPLSSQVKLEDTHPTDIQFDPCSSNYMLAAMRNGSMHLYDLSNGIAEVFTFAKQPAGNRTAAFVPGAPGSFLTVSSKSGVLQLWNVSQQAPQKNLKTGLGAAQSVLFRQGTKHAVITFADGTVAVYDVGAQSMLWRTQGGHTETIFDCRFSCHDPNLLATASYDGTVRVWDVRARTCSASMAGAQETLYSVTWSPDGKALAASSVSGHVYIYDAAKAMFTKRYKLHEGKCMRVAWNPAQPVLASCGEDSTIVVFKLDGSMVRQMTHGGSSVNGVCWSPLDANQLATAGASCKVIVWDLAQPEGPGIVLEGHKKSVFRTEWSPLMAHLLMSGSDDGTARIWNTQTRECVNELKGHTQEVRGLCWHPEVPYLVVTGSWDATIRVWDYRSGQCLHVASEHHGDVYGLAIHPMRPFTLASASRDTTIRLWSLVELTPSLLLQSMLGTPPRSDAASIIRSQLGDLPKMCGSGSAALVQKLEVAKGNVAKFAAVFDFFHVPGGVHTLWDMAAMVASPNSAPKASADSSLQHKGAVRASLMGAANQLELSLNTKIRGIAGHKKEEVLRDAALLQVRAGCLDAACDLLAQAGDWEQAVMLAPAVSLQFWQTMLQRRIEADKSQGTPLSGLLPMYVASGQVHKAVEALVEQGAYDEAADIASVEACGGYSHLSTSSLQVPSGRSLSAPGPSPSKSDKAREGTPDPAAHAQVAAVRSKQAETYHKNGEPVYAACCQLAADNVEGAVRQLVLGHQLPLAAALAIALNPSNKAWPLELLVQYCEAAGEWATAAQLVKMLPDSQRRPQLLAARYMPHLLASDGRVAAFYESLGLKSAASYLANVASITDEEEAVRHLLLGRNYEAATERIIAVLREKLASSTWKLEELASWHQCLNSLHADGLPRSLWVHTFPYTAYLGAHKAFALGYHGTGSFLMASAKRWVAQQAIEFPVSAARMVVEEARARCVTHPDAAANLLMDVVEAPATPAGVREQAQALLVEVTAKGAQPGAEAAVTKVIVAGSTIPQELTKGGPRVSSISNTLITGTGYFLDATSSVTISEAVMLSHVTAFNPSGNTKLMAVL